MLNGKNGLKGGGVGGGNIQIPQSVLLRKPGKKFQMPVDRTKVKGEIDARIAEAVENCQVLHSIGEWLIDIDRATPAERDQFASEIRSYASDLEVGSKDQNPAIRRAGAYEWLRWQFSSQFVTWEEVGQVANELLSKSVLVVANDPEKQLFRCGQTGYTVEPNLGLESAQLAEIKTWFTRIAGVIKTHTLRGWEASIGQMRQASVISLEQLILGEPGPCYIQVPDDPDFKGKDGRPQPLEGGHLLVNSCSGRIFIEDAAGEPSTGKGFAFVRVIMGIKELHPKAFLTAYKLQRASPWPYLKSGQELTDAQRKAQSFFDANPDHARATTILHATIKRGIKLAFKEGKFDNAKAEVRYLGNGQEPVQPSQQKSEPEVKPEPTADTTDSKKPAKKSPRKPAKKDAEAPIPAAS